METDEIARYLKKISPLKKRLRNIPPKQRPKTARHLFPDFVTYQDRKKRRAYYLEHKEEILIAMRRYQKRKKRRL